MLAEALARRGFDIDPSTVRTNIVIATLSATPVDPFLEQLRARGILAAAIGPRQVRFVTHRDIDDDGLAQVIDALGPR